MPESKIIDFGKEEASAKDTEATNQPDCSTKSPEPKLMYLTVFEAAKIAGISKVMMQNLVDQEDNPIPHIKQGKKAYVRAASIETYLDQLCVNFNTEEGSHD